ncbi:MAG: FadR family transcriptional regulator [Spirochaetes bacterium]|nr:FadR family transcriptional regulator [Spirochaetota bacterium]
MVKDDAQNLSLNRITKSPDIPSLVVQQITELIKSGNLKPGDRLPSENEMTRRFGISRISLREAMKLLEAKGYIVSKGRKGKFVQSSEQLPLESKIGDLIAVDHNKIWELLSVRRLIDSEAAMMAAKNATKAQLQELSTFDDDASTIGIENLVSTREGGRLYTKFYHNLADSTNNTIFAHLMKSITWILRGALPYSRQKLMAVPDVSKIFYTHHKNIIEAIRARNPERAKTAVIEHIDWLEKTMKKLLS